MKRLQYCGAEGKRDTTALIYILRIIHHDEKINNGPESWAFLKWNRGAKNLPAQNDENRNMERKISL